MTKEVFNVGDYQKGNKQMLAEYAGVTNLKYYNSWCVIFAINDYSMKSLLKKTNESTFAIKSWLEGTEKETSNEKYWVLCGVAGLIDPFNMSPAMRGKRLKTTKFRKVNKDTFNNFEKYLKTKNTLYFTKARRSLMESV